MKLLRLGVLDDLTLDWMIKRLKHYFPDFPISEAGWVELTAGHVRQTAMSAVCTMESSGRRSRPRCGISQSW
jgi:hypothetical protein